MTKAEERALAVINYLLAMGWTEDGQTDSQTVRIATAKSPVYGRGAYGGGELRTFGGRARFVKPGTEWKVTVGPRTVNFYRVGMIDVSFRNWEGKLIEKFERGAIDQKGFDTGDINDIQAHAETLR